MLTYLNIAEKAIRKAGALLKSNFEQSPEVAHVEQHDIKLKIDVASQNLITDEILMSYPDHMILGEEGNAGNENSEYRWIVDPIDGTVNYYYGIPHFCISIALQKSKETILGLIYEPLLDKLWTAELGKGARYNDEKIKVSNRDQLSSSIMYVGPGKTASSLSASMKTFINASSQARKMRLMGSAALGMAYIASGKFDVYLESRISLWDIAAGKLLIEEAGGAVELVEYKDEPNVYSIRAQNGKLDISGLI